MEEFLEVIDMKIYIRGFAESKKDVERFLSQQTREIIDHLLKCYLMPNHPSANHWKKEIASFFYEVDKLKNTKKFPTAKQIYNWTYGKKQDLVTDERWFSKLVNMTLKEYNMESSENPCDFMSEFDSICVEYFTWLSKELSDVGLVTYDEIYQKLNELL